MRRISALRTCLRVKLAADQKLGNQPMLRSIWACGRDTIMNRALRLRNLLRSHERASQVLTNGLLWLPRNYAHWRVPEDRTNSLPLFGIRQACVWRARRWEPNWNATAQSAIHLHPKPQPRSRHAARLFRRVGLASARATAPGGRAACRPQARAVCVKNPEAPR